MNERANKLKAILEDLFTEATRRSRREANPNLSEVEITGEDRESFDYIHEAMESVLSANFKDNVRYAVPDAEFTDKLRKVLAFRPFSTFEAWHVAPGVTEADLLAAEDDIRSGKIAALESLCDPARKTGFEMPLLDGALIEYRIVLSNLRYLLVVLAHQGKRYSSLPAARAFLSAASLVNRRSKMVPPSFREEDIERVVDCIDEGIDELQIAADYDGMESWEVFGPREGKRFAEVLREKEAQA